jgi:NAD(P)-dependent dehydrogenase (short-subunit alcohol dehydrogenase family)
VVFTDTGGVGSSLVDRLEKRGVDVLTLDESSEVTGLLESIDTWAPDRDITGVYWLAALDRAQPIEDMDLAGWRNALRVRVKLLYATMRHLYDTVSGHGTFLVAATRLGGQLGYDEAGPPAPLGGAVAGFTKTYKREKPDALVKVVDFPMSGRTAGITDDLIEETLTDSGTVEVGRTDDGHRWAVGLTERPLPDEPTGIELTDQSVFVVTGAAGSIVSAITADLAAASGGTFHLLDLVPEPDGGNPDIALFRTNRETLQHQIFERLEETEDRVTPAMVEREIAGIERASAALAAIEAIEAAGGTALYHSVNLLDGDAMREVMASIADRHDRIDVLLHAGGLEISRLLPNKEPSEYDLVFDVKADGWFNLLDGLQSTDIGVTVAFSSIAGRFGNGGQADYSAANDLLCKSSLSFLTSRPNTTAIAIDWTAWGDIGMATRGSIPTVMKAAGIDMLPAAIGTPFVRHEIVGARGSREVLVAGRLGSLMKEFRSDGGIEPEAFQPAIDRSVMLDSVEAFGVHDGLVVTATLDPTRQGFLFDHQIDDTPVLPGVMGIEAFAEAARLPFDGLEVSAIEDIDFLAPFKFYRNEPRTVTITVTYRPDGDHVMAECALVGVRELATSAEPQVTTHFTGRVRLSPQRMGLDASDIPTSENGVVGASDIYRIYFHGSTYQVLDRAWSDGSVVGGSLASNLPPNHLPEDLSTTTAPRLVELCLQTAGMWEIGATGTMALPMHIDRVILGPGDLSDAASDVIAVVHPAGDSFDAVLVDGAGDALIRVEGYRTTRLPGSLSEEDVAPLRRAMTGDA